MNLIIVESPTKAKTLTKFLGADYSVIATMGHVRDLPKKKLGINIEKNYQPEYIVEDIKKQGIINEIIELKKKAKDFFLATDPDREGEAIAWHIWELIKDKKEQDPKRIVFHEITEEAVKEALDNPRTLDKNLIDAQQGRRILDRLVGYKLSPLLWKKIRKGLSAGRVQSVAVRLICEREKEIEKFKSEEYYTIEIKFKAEDSEFVMELISYEDNKYEQQETHALFDGDYTITKSLILTQKQAEEIIADIVKQTYKVINVEEKETRRSPMAPYTTSTLQQEAGRKMGFSAKRTMQAAQKLYEEGLITYHRTDSVNLADKFLKETQQYIEKEYGEKYRPEKPRYYQNKQKLAQEAHEAIRPTHINISQYQGENLTNRDMIKLYDLIWRRALSSQMTEALFNSTAITVEAGKYILKANGLVLLFDGFLKVWNDYSEDRTLPKVKDGEILKYEEAFSKQHFTSSPPRYTEPSLIKSLEEKGIGRPSTYAPTLSTIQERQYVELIEKKFHPTNLGNAVNDFLVTNFAEILDISFTANMEDDLDSISLGEKEWTKVIDNFYKPFISLLAKVQINAERVEVKTEEAGELCDKCGSPMVIRIGRFGKFIACSKFPECKNTKPFVKKLENFKCPQCGSDIVIKKTKKGKSFYGCAGYPNCKWASWTKPK